MYPVISLLRRYAISHVYVRPSQLEQKEGKYWVRLRKPTNALNVREGGWLSTMDLVPMSTLSVSASTSEAAAIALTKKENALAESIRAHETYYTIIMGPETETTDESGSVTRVLRLAVVRGVHRANGPTLDHPPQKPQKVRQYSKVPKGATFERR